MAAGRTWRGEAEGGGGGGGGVRKTNGLNEGKQRERDEGGDASSPTHRLGFTLKLIVSDLKPAKSPKTDDAFKAPKRAGFFILWLFPLSFSLHS